MLRKPLRSTLLFALTIFSTYRATPAVSRYQSDSGTANESRALTASEAAKFLPATVFFRGQSAPIQARNSSGVQFNKNELLLRVRSLLKSRHNKRELDRALAYIEEVERGSS